MQSEKQYIDLYNETQGMIKQHSCDVLNKVRDKAFEDFKRQGFPTKKMERYKYTDISKLFAPDYGLNLQRSIHTKSLSATFQILILHSISL